MKQITLNLYQFHELSPDLQRKAVRRMADINIDHDWHESLYEDAARIGLKITAFDIDRGNFLHGDFTQSPEETAHAIQREHGPKTPTYELAERFLLTCTSTWDTEGPEFERAIREEYLSLLRNEFEYLTSEQAIIDTIVANEYDFTEEGEIY